MTIIELLMIGHVRTRQGSNPSSNSAAIPLPTAFWDPEFRCRPVAQLVSKWLIYLMLPTWRGLFWEAAARFLPGLRERGWGRAPAGPGTGRYGVGAGGRGCGAA